MNMFSQELCSRWFDSDLLEIEASKIHLKLQIFTYLYLENLFFLCTILCVIIPIRNTAESNETSGFESVEFFLIRKLIEQRLTTERDTFAQDGRRKLRMKQRTKKQEASGHELDISRTMARSLRIFCCLAKNDGCWTLSPLKMSEY